MQKTLSQTTVLNAKPFLKWAGGKTQLLDELAKRLPKAVTDGGVIESYVEPFVGGGAVFFYLRNRFDIKKSYLFDINPELIVGYRTIQTKPELLIKQLKKFQDEYLGKSEADRSKLFYEIRALYNDQGRDFNYSSLSPKWVLRTSYMIFLNKTCFNGLFRQNSKGEFNVPFGKYKNPTICDANNLVNVSKALVGTTILLGDFEKSKKYVGKNTLVYLDPPYRPLNETSSFTSYAKDGFNDDDQKRLEKYFENMDIKGAFLILSNSDPKNENPADHFFDDLYSAFKIERVLASRMINCDAKKRGQISELIITNYH